MSFDQTLVRRPRLMRFFMRQGAEFEQDEHEHRQTSGQEPGDQLHGYVVACVDGQYKTGGYAVQHEQDQPFVAEDAVGEEHGKLRSVLLIFD